ncbi:MAG: hypothetical protein BIP78_1268 [Candidatus Bipolaricaulis sibiricus]|uniref:Uncharacterized protein n=1 Tax=Bipolaricaulis sibiricus TaxID=2501609 RepID=A0A410FVK3_BIPS1|nr:MAG: hypothetical protein BIP78_1268 [Candidatus Bipolaricaulis sibiricus]
MEAILAVRRPADGGYRPQVETALEPELPRAAGHEVRPRCPPRPLTG